MLYEVITLKYIISKIADIKDMSFEEVEEVTTANAKKLFKKMIRNNFV